MGTAGKTIRLYLTILKRYRASSVLMLLLIVISIVSVDILAPYYVAQILDTLTEVATNRGEVATAEKLFVSFLVVSVIGMVTWRIVGFWAARRQASIVHRLERVVFERLTLHSYAFFANRFGGALVTQSNRFVRSYQYLEDMFHFEVMPLAIRLLISIAVMMVSVPSIGLALLIWSSFFIASVTWMVAKKQPYTRQASATDTFITARLADVLANILNLKSFGKRSDEVASFRGLSDKRRRIQKRSWTIDEWVWSYTHVLGVIFAIVTLWLSIRVIANGSASIGGVLLAQFYIARISGDLSHLQSIMSRISTALSDAAEMTEILDDEPDIQDVPRPKRLHIRKGEVHFDRIGFAYDEGQSVFRDLSLTIHPGERVGLVGHSGSGKSTLVKLLLRFAEVSDGRITIDGQDITKVAQDDLRSKIAYVAQEPVLFHRTLAENIRYARADATDKEVREVARHAHAAEFIESQRRGYDTLVGERGVKLSGGEKQRIAIARAMLSDAPILVLDEATSSLDSESEKLITDALEKLMKRRTTLVIAHRLSTIQSLDRIVVMKDGKIVEQGTHTELLALDGHYCALWKHQTGGFLDD